MKKNYLLRLNLIWFLLLACSMSIFAANTVTLPSTSILFSDADLTKCSTENDGKNVGSTGSETVMTFKLQNNKAADYILSLKSGAKGLTAVYNILITNSSSKEVFNSDFNVENTSSWTPTTDHAFYLENLAVGEYTMVISVKSTTGKYAGNLGDLSIAESTYDHIPGAIDLTKGTYNGPRVESAGNVGYVKNNGTASYTFYNTQAGVFNMLLDIYRYNIGGNLNIKIKDISTGEEEFATDYTIAENAPESYTTNTINVPSLSKGIKNLTFTFSNGNSYICNYNNLKFEYLGDVVITEPELKTLTIDGVESDLVSALNTDPYTATLSGNVYTSVPTVAATLTTGNAATVTYELNADKTAAIYTITGVVGENTRTYTLTINGLNIYTPGEKDEKANIKFTAAGKTDGNTWTDGLYTFYVDGKGIDGWENKQFKINGNACKISVPANVIVKQVVLKDFYDNYVPAAENGVRNFASEGATTYLPTKNSHAKGSENQYDLVVNLDGHQAGKDITFEIFGGNQPVAWFELTIEKVAITTAPVLVSSSVTSTENKNHCVVALQFDREMKATTATINGQNVTAEGGSTTLYFPIWNLNYNTEYTFTVAADVAKDTYNNGNTEAIVKTITVGSKATAAKAEYDYVVATAEEFIAAVDEINASNTKADAARKTIFLKNGDYDLGTGKQIKAYNVSLIGESQEGVLLHGANDGISNPILNIRDREGFYLQDITVKNDSKFGTWDGVAVAIYGGNKTIMKHVRMLSGQDTQVTGDRAYIVDSEIHGTVDFICGGGDNYFANTTIVLENRKGDVIAAPSTSETSKWGYVFQNCNINAADGADLVTDGSYNLGRPWKDAPRAYYLNTTMNVLPDNNGWTNMSNLPTYFYEYNSMDANGNAIDLSVRGNSPSSTNHYTPVLNAEEAAQFTLQNVLGGTDSWLPSEECQDVVAPVITLANNQLSWSADADARLYAIFKDGEFYAQATETTFEVTENGTYTVRAANQMGGLGQASNEVVNGGVTLKVSAAGWATFSSKAALDFTNVEGVKAYTAKNNNGTINYTLVSGAVPANEGLLIQAEEGEYSIPAATTTPAAIDNDFVGTATGAVVSDGTFYALANMTDGIGLYRVAEGVNIPAGKAYIQITNSNAKRFYSFEDVITGIKNLELGTENLDQVYNLAGQKVGNNYKGIVIKNGKKYINK